MELSTIREATSCEVTQQFGTQSLNTYFTSATNRKSILILSTYLRLGLPSGLFPSGFPINNL
jgi:hypothetical protein